MAEIAFMTNVRLLKNVDLSNDYEHTYYFASASAQQSFFSNKTSVNLQNYSYQRHTRNSIRVGVLCDDILGCNYMMFQNPSFGSKWFYAFITDIEYVNNNTSTVFYEIDQIQTWFFNVDFGACYVERCHSSIDGRGLNRVEENIAYGDYVVARSSTFGNYTVYRCFALLASKIDVSGITINAPNTVNNIFNGLYYTNAMPQNTAKSLVQAYIDNGVLSDIVALYQVPLPLSDNTENEVSPGFTTTFGNYTPKNAKLYSSPYVKLMVINNQGNCVEYDPDSFSGNITFRYKGCVYPTPSAFCWPMNYKGVGANYLSGITLNNGIMCAYAGDSFKAWLAQNKAANATGLLATGLSGAVSVGVGLGTAINPGIGTAVGAIAGVGVSLASKVLGDLSAGQRAEASPDGYAGQMTGDAILASQNRYQFEYYQMNIREEYARIIDNYFTRYGYAQKKVMKLNLNARRWWTFIKTVGCDVTGNIPNDAAKVINSAFDKGITMWNQLFDGDYTRDNPTL